MMRWDIPSGMCAKLRTVAASNNRGHASQSLLLLLARATYIMVLFFTHIPFVVNHTINATPPERLQQHPLLFATTDRAFFVWRLSSVRPSHPGHSTILLTYLSLCWCVTHSVTHKQELWIWFTLSYAMMKALLRLAAVRDTKQAGKLRGDTVHFIASSSALVLMTQNGNIYRPLTQTATCLLRLYSSKHIAENS